MRRLLFIVLFISGLTFNGSSQTTALKSDGGEPAAKPAETIHWMSFLDAVKAGGQKKIFIDVYTKWCGWCKRMDASTYEDPAVEAYINKYYYPVRLDAETRDTIVYKEKVYAFVPQYKANLIALELLSGQMSYPTSVYLDEQFNML